MGKKVVMEKVNSWPARLVPCHAINNIDNDLVLIKSQMTEIRCLWNGLSCKSGTTTIPVTVLTTISTAVREQDSELMSTFSYVSPIYGTVYPNVITYSSRWHLATIAIYPSWSLLTIKLTIRDDHSAGAGTQRNQDTCQGDSGGPLVCLDPAKKLYHLAGITSFGDDCGTGVGGQYTKVATYIPWIYATATPGDLLTL